MAEQKENSRTVRFRTTWCGSTYIGEATVTAYSGSGLTDDFGYTDDDDTSAELLEVWNEDAGTVVAPEFLFAGPNLPFRRTLEVAAYDEYYNPTSSMKVFPGEEEAYFDGLVSLGKFDHEGWAIAA
jgi:hypothetical protein